MGCKLMEKVLKKKYKTIYIEKDIFPCLFTREWAKHTSIWNCSSDNELQTMESKVVLSKLAPMNHCH